MQPTIPVVPSLCACQEQGCVHACSRSDMPHSRTSEGCRERAWPRAGQSLTVPSPFCDHAGALVLAIQDPNATLTLCPPGHARAPCPGLAASRCAADGCGRERAVDAPAAGPAAGCLARHVAERHRGVPGHRPGGRGRALPAGAGRRRLQGGVQHHRIAAPASLLIACAPSFLQRLAEAGRGKSLQGRRLTACSTRRPRTDVCLCCKPFGARACKVALAAFPDSLFMRPSRCL
jgi:hypothetical protein